MFFERRIALIQEQLVWWSGGLHLTAACGMVDGGGGSIDGDGWRLPVGGGGWRIE